ncbi:MAG: hypothetical protein EOM80_01280 [Erysipelotrichia bacterium]|nr:hypothetical protein [Erysipelotrichia bacterium]
MKNSDTPFFLGYVEQGIGGSQDPLMPPISISRNGTLAKWRGKLHFINLRVNDPGLKKNAAAFEDMLQKTETLGIKTIITLPEYVPHYYELPPEPPASDKPEEKVPVRKTAVKKPVRLVHFRPCYLSLPAAIEGNPAYHTLSVEDCLPIIEMAAKFKVGHIIVPVSEPGIFLDPQAENRFKKALKSINEVAKVNNIRLHLRNGGISASVFQKMAKEFGCGLAYNVGVAHLERDDIIETYRRFADNISIVILQQVLPGLDKWGARRDDMEQALKNYAGAKKEYSQSLSDNDEAWQERCLKNFNKALHDYYESCRNACFNLGLFQNGDLNLVPLLKELRKDLEAGHEKFFLLETVPNTKNSDLIARYVLPDNFPGSF